MPKKAPAPAAKKPKQQRLPGTEDARIDALEDLAEEYAEIRDKRIALNKEESTLKDKLRDIMKANKKRHYVRDGVEIDIVPEGEKLKVIKKEGDGE